MLRHVIFYMLNLFKLNVSILMISSTLNLNHLPSNVIRVIVNFAQIILNSNNGVYILLYVQLEYVIYNTLFHNQYVEAISRYPSRYWPVPHHVTDVLWYDWLVYKSCIYAINSPQTLLNLGGNRIDFKVSNRLRWSYEIEILMFSSSFWWTFACFIENAKKIKNACFQTISHIF